MIQAGLRVWTISNLEGARHNETKRIPTLFKCHTLAKAGALTEVNEKASVALALILWKNHDA